MTKLHDVAWFLTYPPAWRWWLRRLVIQWHQRRNR